MPERRRRTTPRRERRTSETGTAPDPRTRHRPEPDPGGMMRGATRAAHGRYLDDPARADEASASRHVAYFLAVVGGAAVLNLLVLAVIAR